jgi:hypothetical protein
METLAKLLMVLVGGVVGALILGGPVIWYGIRFEEEKGQHYTTEVVAPTLAFAGFMIGLVWTAAQFGW